jgi:hypothetical protein
MFGRRKGSRKPRGRTLSEASTQSVLHPRVTYPQFHNRDATPGKKDNNYGTNPAQSSSISSGNAGVLLKICTCYSEVVPSSSFVSIPLRTMLRFSFYELRHSPPAAPGMAFEPASCQPDPFYFTDLELVP